MSLILHSAAAWFDGGYRGNSKERTDWLAFQNATHIRLFVCPQTEAGVCIYSLGVFESVKQKRKRKKKKQSHRSHCCDPVPGVGTRSRAPLTGGSTISHSLADGPVYSATQRRRANEQEREGGGGKSK